MHNRSVRTAGPLAVTILVASASAAWAPLVIPKIPPPPPGWRGCVVATDPEGDVAINGRPQTHFREQVDIRSVQALMVDRTLRISIQLTSLHRDAPGTWIVTFQADRQPLTAIAHVESGPTAKPTFHAGPVGGPLHPVTGRIEHRYWVEIDVPFDLTRGALAPSKVVSDFAVHAEHSPAQPVTAAPTPVAATDDAAARHRVLVDSRCYYV